MLVWNDTESRTHTRIDARMNITDAIHARIDAIHARIDAILDTIEE